MQEKDDEIKPLIFHNCYNGDEEETANDYWKKDRNKLLSRNTCGNSYKLHHPNAANAHFPGNRSAASPSMIASTTLLHPT